MFRPDTTYRYGAVCVATAWFGLKDMADIRKVGYTDVVPNKRIDIHDAYDIANKYFSTPVFTGTYNKRQAQWVKHHGIKVGSKVKVVRKFEGGEEGSGCLSWDSDSRKKKMQDSTGVITEVRKKCVTLDSGSRLYTPTFPYFVLEPVK